MLDGKPKWQVLCAKCFVYKGCKFSIMISGSIMKYWFKCGGRCTSHSDRMKRGVNKERGKRRIKTSKKKKKEREKGKWCKRGKPCGLFFPPDLLQCRARNKNHRSTFLLYTYTPHQRKMHILSSFFQSPRVKYNATSFLGLSRHKERASLVLLEHSRMISHSRVIVLSKCIDYKSRRTCLF